MKYRLIRAKVFDAYMNMAIEEAIMESVRQKKSPPTIRFFKWEPAAVSIGYFQSTESEVNLEKCKDKGFDVVRRITGGGAVVHNKEITYSIIAPVEEFDKDIIKSYEQICGYIIKALDILGIKAVFKPINDVLVDNKKISGSAQTRRQGILLQHGTLIFDTKQEEILSYLQGKTKKHNLTKSSKKIITCVTEHSDVTLNDVEKALEKAFASDRQVETGEITTKELERAKELAKNKYSSREWNYLR